MNAQDRLNLTHLGDDLIIAGTEMLANDEPTMLDLQMIAIDLETTVRKIRLYAHSMHQEGRF